MSTMTLRITSSAVNASGTGLGQGPDLHAPSFYDAIITDSTNPNLPNGTYDAYCLHPLLTINFSPTLYDATSSDGENVADYIAADVAAITDTQIDQINWLLAQNFTADPIFAGQYNYGEVQAAIYELLGYTPAEYNIGITPDILSDNGRQTLERTDIDFLVAQAQAAIASGNNVVPTDAYFSALIDPEGNVQPLIVQLQSAKLGNFVWQDGNNNGLQDAGELGVNNVVVELYDNAGTLIATTTTGDDFSTAAVETGFYQFTGLQAGDYQVKFVPPANMALTVKDANSNGQDTLDSDADTATGLSDIISLAAGESNQTIDAGLVQPTAEPASISGFVYCDDNDDGVKDAGEAGLGGVTVQLLNAAGAVVSTTTTGADGSYSFTNLAAGTYSVVEPTQPAGKNDGKETAGSTGGDTSVNDTISQITVNAGEDSVNNNFGEVTPPPEAASISGFVYCDDNDDGVKDAGEAGLSGVTVQLLNAAGAVVSTTTTDANGAYSFTGLDAGTYSVVEPTQPAGKDDGKETAGSTGGNTDVNDTISQITVDAGEDSVNNNFGEVTPPPEPASISGFVYCDDNDDGVKDAGEAGLSGVTVQLLNAAGAVVSTTTTGADGSYSFTGLDAGTYSVVEPNQPAGKDDGKETAGSTGGNTTVNDTISQITVDAGEDSVNNNFGEVTPPPELASISGFVYCDDNDDGVKDAGEAGLSGVTVQLLNAAGAVVSTTTTGADGSYSFTGLDAGTYSVVEPTQPAGKDDGKETAGSTGGNTDVNDTISQITVNAGEDSVNNNFGEVTPPPEPASISGFVYCDDNDDGVKDAGEAGLSGVTVQLLNAAGAVASTTTTDANGAYSFTGLAAGTYSVVEPTQPAGKDDGKETAGSTGGNTDVNDTISQITVNAGEDSVNNNFGEVTPPPEPASISGFVYCDDNDDGVKDAGEAGLGGVTVQLLNAAGAVVSTTTTDANGAYSFTGLDAGTYSVVEPTQPAGKNDGKETAGSTGGDTSVNDTISQITVNAGENSVNNNFGEVTPPPEPASISGFVYCDDNDDGVKDAGEAGLSGVTVQLLNAAGAVVSTTTTDANGAYSFTGLAAGTYSVVEPTQPAGKDDGKETAGSTGGNTDVNDTISQITVDAGENSTGNNFGEVTPEPAKLGDTVFEDTNANGIQDAGESGIANVTVNLKDKDGNIINTTTTDANGNYGFTVAPGTYSVGVVTPAGFIVTDANQGTDDAKDSDINPATGMSDNVTLVAGENNPTIDAGLYQEAQLGDRVWLDANKNGVQDNGETGVQGVEVTLLDSNGDSVGSPLTTDANGNYLFTDLRPGTYSVQFDKTTLPAGHSFTDTDQGADDGLDSDADTTDGTTIQTVLESGESDLTWDAGIVANPKGSISGKAFCDLDCNGLLNEIQGNDHVLGQNLIANGDFEDNALNNSGSSLGIDTGLGGNWFDIGSKPAQVHEQDYGHGNATGDAIVELEKGVILCQKTDLTEDGTYLLGFDVTRRGTSDQDNTFELFIDGVRHDTYTVTQAGRIEFELDLSAGEHRFDFKSNSQTYIGAGLDDVSLQKKDPTGTGQNEPTKSGVEVKLLDTNGNVVATTQTDANGEYVFDNLPDGDYQVMFTSPDGTTFTDMNVGNDDTIDSDVNAAGMTDVINISGGNDVENVDAGLKEQHDASLGDYVWFDENGNGRQDDGNNGMNGVTVNLLDSNGDQVATTTTADDSNGNSGYYLFDNLPQGDYQVEFVSPDGFQFTTQNQGDDAGDSDADTTTGLTVTTTLEAGENDLSWDAGLIKCTAKLGDRVWLDANKNGIQDAGEAGVADVTVTLVDAGADGQLNTADDIKTTTTTDANGNYLFTEVENGKYQILFDVPDDLNITVPNAGSDDAKDSDVMPARGLKSVGLTAISSSAVWTGNGGGYIEDSLDDAFAYDPDNPTGPMPTTTWGSSDGTTGFHSKLANGQDAHAVYGLDNTYIVGSNSDSFVIDFYGRKGFESRDNNFDVKVFDANGSAIGVVTGLAIPSGAKPHLRVDIAAELNLASGQTIGSFEVIGHDTAHSSANYFTLMEVRAAATSPLEQVKLTPVSSTAAWTGHGGGYIEDSLDDAFAYDPGNPTGPMPTVVWGSTDGTTGFHSNVANGQDAHAVYGLENKYTVGSTDDSFVVDFYGRNVGQSRDDNFDVKVLDADGNSIGVVTGLAIPSGATPHLRVDLVSELNLTGGQTIGSFEVIGHDTADSNGNYFTLMEVRAAATNSSATAKTDVITIDNWQDDLTIDAGLVTKPAEKASIGNFVWEDKNFNGIQDPDEPGVADVKISLFAKNSSGQYVKAQTTTDANGYYSFENLDAGQYHLNIDKTSLPTGAKLTHRDKGGDDTKDSDAFYAYNTILTNWTHLSEGENDPTWDIGIYHKASIGDRVWVDHNHNQIQDVSEYGVAGIKVYLHDSTGARIASTTTNSQGNYLFNNLNPGSYYLEFDKGGVWYYAPQYNANYKMDWWKWAKKDIGNNDNIDSDVNGDAVSKVNVTRTDYTFLESGENDLSWDAGITPIVIDLNGDGIQTISRENAQGSFDLFGNGTEVESGWISGDDGFLAIDSNGNGTIDDISELFGGVDQGDGFAKLASFDSNGNGVVNADDADFESLLIWQDANGDHQTDAGELVSLTDAGIESLTVDFIELPFIDNQGNLHLERSTATLTDGTAVDMTDVYFNVALADAQAAGFDGPSLDKLSGYDQVIPEEVVDVPSAFVVDPVWAV